MALVESLVQARASPVVRDKRGCTPIDVAEGDVQMILEASAGASSSHLAPGGREEELFSGQHRPPDESFHKNDSPWGRQVREFLQLPAVVRLRCWLQSSPWWADLSPQQRKKYIYGAAACVGIVALYVAWWALWLALAALRLLKPL